MFNRNTKFVKYAKIVMQISVLMFVLILLSRYSFSSYLRENVDLWRNDIVFRGNVLDNTLFYKSMALNESFLTLIVLLTGLVLVVPVFFWILKMLVKFVSCVVERIQHVSNNEKSSKEQIVCLDVYLKQEKLLC